MTTRSIFVNLPVKDVAKTMDFFSRLGFEFNQQFTDDKAACMVLNDQAYVMLLDERFFTTFTTKQVCDTTAAIEGLFAVSAPSREAVDELVDAALAAGGQPAGGPQDHGFMYQRGFADLDGHCWEVLWMDEATVQS